MRAISERIKKAALSVDDRLFVDPETVRRLLEDQFPHWAHLPVAAVTPGGWSNRTFRLGDQMTVRLPSADRYAQGAKKEQGILPRLASGLPVLIPKPIALGDPGAGYPFHWSIMRWIEGETPARAQFGDSATFARDMGGFLRALHRFDASAGPEAGEHSFHRGGSLRVYDAEVKVCFEDPRRRDRRRSCRDGMGRRRGVTLAVVPRLGARGPGTGQPARGGRPVARRHRLRQLRGGGSRLRSGHRLDVLRGSRALCLPRASRSRSGSLAARTGVGDLEGDADHVGKIEAPSPRATPVGCS
jgi:hypothetical protein